MRPRMIDTLGGLGLLVMTLMSATSHVVAQTNAAAYFALAGPGLRSPDEAGGRVALLYDIAGATALGPTGPGMLASRMVFAVVAFAEARGQN